MQTTHAVPLIQLEPTKPTFLYLPVGVGETARQLFLLSFEQVLVVRSITHLPQNFRSMTRISSSAFVISRPQIVNEDATVRQSAYAGATTASGASNVELSRLHINVTWVLHPFRKVHINVILAYQ